MLTTQNKLGRKYWPLCSLLATVFVLNLKADTNRMITLFDFSGNNPSPAWNATNDGVMGGLSEGGAQLVKEGMLFSGTLSLKNNGGFSTVHAEGPFDLSEFDGLRVRVLGDGRTYQLRLRSDAIFRNRGYVAFGREFATIKGEWIEVFVPFEDLSQSWRGRKLSGYTFNAADVRRIGFMIADKQPGDFGLKIRSISAETIQE